MELEADSMPEFLQSTLTAGNRGPARGDTEDLAPDSSDRTYPDQSLPEMSTNSQKEHPADRPALHHEKFRVDETFLGPSRFDRRSLLPKGLATRDRTITRVADEIRSSFLSASH